MNIGTNWILLVHNGDQLQALENKLMNFLSSIKGSSPSSQKPVTELYSECNPTYIFATRSFKIHFNIIISSTLMFPIVSCQVFLQQNRCIWNNSGIHEHRHELAKHLCLFIEDVQATVCTSLDDRGKSVSILN